MINSVPASEAMTHNPDLLGNIRELVAEHLAVGVEYITASSHFSDDLGMDWLDVIELIILVEDRFPELAVVEGGEIAFFADLMQHIQIVDGESSNNGSFC